MSTLDELARKAHEAHMTYGQYMAKFGAAQQEKKKPAPQAKEKKTACKACLVCGAPLKDGRIKYCSRACYSEAIQRRKNEEAPHEPRT